MISICAGYGTEGSRTPTTVAVRVPSLKVLPAAAGSLFSEVVQKRWVRTTAHAASGRSSAGASSLSSSGRRVEAVFDWRLVNGDERRARSPSDCRVAADCRPARRLRDERRD
jgi:hypothetical protein